MNGIIQFLLALTLLLGVSGCASAQEVVELGETRWLLVSLDDRQPPVSEIITLKFSDHGISGVAGFNRNRYGAGYRMEAGHRIEIGEVSNTEMYCSGIVGDFEKVYLSSIREVTVSTRLNVRYSA